MLALIQSYKNYTIPRNNRELQPFPLPSVLLPIIPYQEIIGNYSDLVHHDID